MASSPRLPPRGSWIFWQSALRNRLSKKTDEGQRYLKVSDFPVEWYNSEHLPLIQLHSLTSPSPPLISHNENIGSEVPLFCCDSFPPGEAKGKKPQAIHNQRITLSRKLAGRLLGDPYSWRCKTMGTHHSLRHSLRAGSQGRLRLQ